MNSNSNPPLWLLITGTLCVLGVYLLGATESTAEDVDFLKEADEELERLEKEYPNLPKQITLCWSEKAQRFVPVYRKECKKDEH